MTCLHSAVEREDLPLIKYLLKQETSQQTKNSEGLSPLYLAVTKKLLEPLRILLEMNKSSQVVNTPDKDGRTLLHLAVEKEWILGASLLLEAGADVKIASKDKQTVLHIAAGKSDQQLLEMLLTIPESVDMIEKRNNMHKTSLCCAVTSGKLECVSLLLAWGADIRTKMFGGKTLLHVVAMNGDWQCLGLLLRDERVTEFKNLLSGGGVTALHRAALGGYLECVKLLVTAGCDLYAVTTNHPFHGSTALHLAASLGHYEVVKWIVEHDKRTLCAMNYFGCYPLHTAATWNKQDCVKYMLHNGANLAARTKDSEGWKKTALDIIVHNTVDPDIVLENIFDDCLQVNDYPLSHPKYTIKIDYSLLQPLGSQRKQLKVLNAFLNCDNPVAFQKILLHPLVETFLHLKWKKLRLFFFMRMALYLVFTVSLTTMVMFHYVLMIQSEVVDICISTCRLTLCLCLIVIVLQEVLQATRLQRYYVKDLESWVKWSTFILSSVVVLGHHPAPWLVHVSAVAVLLSWLELLFLLSRWPSALGFYILMLFTVAKNVLLVFATFTFVILGFTFAFMIHFQAKGPFGNWWEALVKVLVMMQEFDYESLYEGIEGVDATSIVGRSIFLSFMILVAIVLMNLLVGLAVSDIATLEKQGRAQRLAKQIVFFGFLEMFVYNNNLFAYCPKKIYDAIQRCRAAESSLTVEPGKPFRKTSSDLPFQLRQSVINLCIKKSKNNDKGKCEENASEKETTIEFL